MFLIKWFYEELKDSTRDLKFNLSCACEYLYYWIFKGDNYSKDEFKFSISKIPCNLIAPFKHTWTGIVNVWKWFHIVWEDRNWDYCFLMYVLQFKLKLMEGFFFSKNTHIEDAEKFANEIKRCREILDDIIEEKSHEEIMDEYHKKYPYDDFFRFESTETEQERVKKGLPARMYELIDKRKMTEEDKDVRDKFFKECIEKANKKQDELYRELFNIIRDRIRYWWD